MRIEVVSINPKNINVIILIFQKRAKKCIESKFYELVEIVQSYTYLGRLISSTCNFSVSTSPVSENSVRSC